MTEALTDEEAARRLIEPEQAVEAARSFCRRDGLHFQVTGESKGQIPTYTVEAKPIEPLVDPVIEMFRRM